jgi:hypothetical protein
MILFTALQCLGGVTVLLVTFIGNRPVETLWNPFVKGSRIKPEVSLDTAYTTKGEPARRKKVPTHS